MSISGDGGHQIKNPFRLITSFHNYLSLYTMVLSYLHVCEGYGHVKMNMMEIVAIKISNSSHFCYLFVIVQSTSSQQFISFSKPQCCYLHESMKMDVKVQLWNNGMELLNKLNFDYSITTIEQECVLHFHEHGIPSFKKI